MLFRLLNKNDLGIIFNQGSPVMIADFLSAEHQSWEKSMWIVRAQQLALILADALCDLRDKRVLRLSAKEFQKNLSLKEVYALSNNESVCESIRERLKAFIEMLPRGSRTVEEAMANPSELIREQHGYVIMHLAAPLEHFVRIEGDGEFVGKTA